MDFRALICVAVFFCEMASAHNGHHHSAEAEQPAVKSGPEAAFAEINRGYEEKIKPLFAKSCFDCHSQDVHYPWYYKIPGARQLIDNDIAEAREHLDFTGGFPFKGHGEPVEDLEAIRDAVKDGSMPPFRYRLMHSGATLNEQDRQVILQWVEESLAAIRKN